MSGEHLTWRKSSQSDEEFNCVEVARVAGYAVAVRDSTDRDGGALFVRLADWSALVSALR
ncbi:DUF397 domain-containing protein [Actinomadura oligospora]|uniref:DUF397 domain-containing protein n=1 Tax=Actinomadura oligospora TaxID=111804 RepID=UPI0009FE0E4D|nr:DUF397 domain-containing protein [Actinomadura oligospora]